VVQRIDGDDHPHVVTRRMELDGDGAVVRLDTRDKIHGVRDGESLVRTKVRETRACGCSGRKADLLRRRDLVRRLGDHVVVNGAADTRLEQVDLDASADGTPPRLEAVLRRPEIP